MDFNTEHSPVQSPSEGETLISDAGDAEGRELTPEEELDEMLFEDESRLGDVYRLQVRQGMSAAEIAHELNVATVGFVYSYRATIDAVREGNYPDGPTRRVSVRSALRSLLKRNKTALSREASAILASRVREVSALIEEDNNTEQAEASRLTNEDEPTSAIEALQEVPGIYAFSYGWYLEHPVDEEFNTTLMKVGRADNMGRRISEHQAGARAHIPEPLVVVRAYRANGHDLLELEKTFHRLLSTAGHDNPRRSIGNKRNEVGREWFQTNEQFLDAVASALNLRTEYSGQSDFLTNE